MSDRQPNKQPNLLFIYADQHRADAMGCAGNDIVVTPHLDRLAAEGVRFDHAWTEGPICQPARASLLTGRYPNDHGAARQLRRQLRTRVGHLPAPPAAGRLHHGVDRQDPLRHVADDGRAGHTSADRGVDRQLRVRSRRRGVRPVRPPLRRGDALHAHSCANTMRSSRTKRWCRPTSAAATGTGTASPLPCRRSWTSPASWPTRRSSGSVANRATDRGSCSCRSCNPTCRSWATRSGPSTTPTHTSSASPAPSQSRTPTSGPTTSRSCASTPTANC